MVLDATCQKLSLLYLECLEQKSKQDDSDCSTLDTSYQRKVEAFLGDENLYRIVMVYTHFSVIMCLGELTATLVY